MSKKKLIQNIFSVGIIQVANYIFPIITIPIVSRIIGPDKFGVVNFNASFVAYFTLLIGFGFDLTATRKVAADPTNEKNRNKVFSEVFTSQSLLLLFSVIVFIVLFNTIPQLKEEKEVAIFSFIMCFGTLFTQNWLFQAMQDLPKIAILNLFSKIVYTIIILLAIRQKSDYIWQPLALSLSLVTIALISFLWAVKKYNLKLYRVKFIDCIQLLWNEKMFFFSLCVISLYTNTNVVILGIVKNSTEVGYYTAGQKLISIVIAILSIPLTQALYPYIGKAFAEDYKNGIIIVQKLIPIVFMITFLAGIAIFLGSPLFINIFYGEAFKPAIKVCRILAFMPLLISLSTVLGIHIMLNLKMDKLFFKITVVGAVLSIVINIILAKSMGSTGSAFTWLFAELIILLLFFITLRKRSINVINFNYFNIKYYKKEIYFMLKAKKR